MRTLATKQPSNDSAKHKKSGSGVRSACSSALRSRNFSPLSTGMPLLQRQCACGGGCPRCQEEMGIQTKLKIGEPNDKYEQEADRIANQIMRIATPRNSSSAKPINQSQNLLQTKQQSTASGQTAAMWPDMEAKIASLTGGTLLPANTRSFFETRFGRDFSRVRIHSGNEASLLNESIQSYAFTYQDHIWLGAGSTPKPSYLLAHELTHVIQQTEPTTLKSTEPSNFQTTPIPQDSYLQRFAPYWEPADYNGTRTHNRVLPEISQLGSLFVEAPVPNANKLSSDYDKWGIADIYQADNTVGVYFSGSQVPVALNAQGRLRYRGNTYDHDNEAAPQLSQTELQTVTNVSNAPGSITIGDLKPSHGTIEALEGESQVRNYLGGFRLASREVNELDSNGRADGRWTLSSLSLFSQTQLQALIPAQYNYPATSQTARLLVLKQNSRPIRPFIRANGKLILTPDPSNQGILNYVWVPDLPPSFELPARLQLLGEQIQQRIVDPLLQAPQQTPTGQVSPLLRSTGRLPRLAQPRLQRTLRDSFSLGNWRTARNEIRQQYRTMRRTPDLENARSASLVVEAHQAIENNTQLNVPEPSQQTRESSRTFTQLEFWTGRASGAFGLFRRLFGRTFVRVAEAYQRMRRRFGDWLRNRRLSGAGGGLPGAAVKAIFSVLKMAGTLILSRTLDLLRDSLAQGLSRKLIALIPEDNIAELQAKVAEVQQLREQLQQRAIGSAEALVEQVFPNFSEHLDQMQQVVEIVGNISRIVSLVRWGARAIACVSPPAVGCLWALGQAALEELAAIVVQSCWFQEKIAPWVARVNYLRDELPRSLATTIISSIQSLLPEGLRDVFTEVTASQVRPEEIECDTSEGPGRPLTGDQLAILELQEQLGEARFTALMVLLQRSGINAGVPFNRAMAERIGQFIEQEGLTAELEQFLQQLRQERDRSPVEPVLPEPPPTASADTEADLPEYRTVVVAGRDPESRPDAPDTSAGESGRQPVDVLEADAQSSGAGSGTALTGWAIRIVRVRDRLVAGNIIRVDMRMSRRVEGRQIVRFLRNLRAEVVEIVPSDGDPRQQEAFLEIIEDQSFVFSPSEGYVYNEGTEFVYRFMPRSRP